MMIEGAPHEYKESKGGCSDCGNSPVNHLEHYVANTLAVWSAESAYRGGFLSRVTDVLGRLFDIVEQPFLRALAHMPGAAFSTDVSRAATYRSQVVWEEAQRRGIQMEQLILFGKGTEIYRAMLDDRWHYFQSLPVPASLTSRHADWIDDKYLLKEELGDALVAVPRAYTAKNTQEALRAFDVLGGSVVIKPRSGSRGRHTSVGLRRREDIAAAFASAQKLCRQVVVEKCLSGNVCRGTVVGGKLVGFFEATAPRVVGDGASTIAELIVKANAEKPERVENIELSDEHTRFLARTDRFVDSVPGSGEIVALTHRTGRLFGGRTREILGKEHSKLRAQLEKAAAVLETPIVGFDLIIEDPEKDPDTQEWGVIEANGLPYIDLHYLPLEGTPSNVASDVWDLWEKASSMHRERMDARHERVRIAS